MGARPDNATLARIRERLENEMNRVREEIRRYPSPIPACDAQFNYFLESRQAPSPSPATRCGVFGCTASVSPGLRT